MQLFCDKIQLYFDFSLSQRFHVINSHIINSFTLQSISNLSTCRWQYGLFSPSESSFTPESCRSLLLRSSSLRTQFEDWRADDKLSQHWAV